MRTLPCTLPSGGARLGRRLLLSAPLLPLLEGCGAPLPPVASTVSSPAGRALLDAAAAAHGSAAWSGLHDVSVRYAGRWRPLVGTLQPDLVDAGHRGMSEERLLPGARLTAQAYAGPAGRKQVARRIVPGGMGTVSVWFDGQPVTETAKLDAAALVADGYALFLLGPMLLASPWLAGSAMVLTVAEPERITVAGQPWDCDVLRVRLVPGLGRSDGDDLSLFIDRGQRLMRRVRFTLNGLESTRGAVAEVDCSGHVRRAGVLWPTRFHEHLLRPLPLPVHDWQLERLDTDRGLAPEELTGPGLTGKAAAPAQPLLAEANSPSVPG